MTESFVLIKIFSVAALSFLIAILWTPFLTYFLYKYKLGKQIRTSDSAPIMSALHQKKSGTPTMGGVLIWLTVLVVALLFAWFADLFDGLWSNLSFLSRSETWLPLGALVASALVGLIDDLLNILRWGPKGGGMSVKARLLNYTFIAAVGAWWFYYKLGWSFIHVPFLGNFAIGWWYIPVFIFIIVATAFSVNEIDGLDGLAGGTLFAAFAVYGAIAYSQGRYDLATLCAAIIGSLLAFLWFNIGPARFFMGDTGAMSLGVTLGIIAMLTNQALLLPIIGLLFVVESLSVIIQIISKKIFGKKVFLSAPIHHHLEAKGWVESKIVMRFWVISAISGLVGLILFLLDKNL